MLPKIINQTDLRIQNRRILSPMQICIREKRQFYQLLAEVLVFDAGGDDSMTLTYVTPPD
jgi:hypothetical protein